MEEFTITKDHIKLLKRMFIEWDGSCYEGAPGVDLKRPYGNSGVYEDICEILGLHEPCGECGANEDSLEKAQEIHLEMLNVLQIICCTAAVKTGTYIKKDRYDSLSWVLKKK